MLRSQMLEQLSDYIVKQACEHPLRVAIDGVDAAGKSRLVKELLFPLRKHRRPIITISLDNFHHPRQYRYRRGEESPEGYYYDSFNYPAIIENVLKPLGPDGSRNYSTGVFDLTTNTDKNHPEERAEDNAILLMDGIFMMRPELNGFWDLTIFLDISFETSIERAIQRDLTIMGSYEALQRRYQRRYIPGQELYLQLCHPKQRANVLIENDDFRNPVIYFQRQVAG
ncbi:MAG: uridine kinase [Chloroflexi bacterium HGW-Chloroflexi-10]|nr:MAG: uridine kinase [Chloroflexi bacterium HGW-Chloroflexi-10]